MATKHLRFNIPAREFNLGAGQWFWELTGWPFVKSPRMTLLGRAGSGFLALETTRRVATERVRRFCKAQGFEETIAGE